MTRPPNLTPDQRESLDNMIWSLFGQSNPPFYDSRNIPKGVLDEFTQRDDVLAAAVNFISSLTEIWKTQYPKTILYRLKIHPQDVVKRAATDTQQNQEPPTPIPRTAADLVANDSVKNTTLPAEDSTNQAAHADKPANPAFVNQSSRPGSIPPAGTPPSKPTGLTAIFQTPNAKSGLDYRGKIAEIGAAPRSIQFRNVRFCTDLGLSFDEISGELFGTPVVAGDHEITFQWSEDDGKSWSSGKCLLIVNHDPRYLWKIIEPLADDPYYKPNTDKRLIPAAGFKIAAASRRGRSHEHSGTFRDDDFFVDHNENSGWSVLIVADGAGSAKSSRWGSKLAVKSAGEHLVSNLAGEIGSNMNTALNGWDANPAVKKTMNDTFYLLFQKAASLAVEAIEVEAKSKNAPVKEYSTTLLAAAVKRQGTETFVATFWMGDGAIAAYGPRGKMRPMGAPDGGEFAGQTRFLDRAALMDKDFSKRVNIGRFPDLLSVMLMTDGISDPRFETDNGLKDATKWDALWDEIDSCLKSPKPDESLVEWLHFFTPGHHDDRTIALLW